MAVVITSIKRVSKSWLKALTPEVFAQKVEAEFEHTRETLKIQPEILKN